MNAEIIAVGSELLLGQIDNTNASFLSRELSSIGINVFYHQAVGDNEARLTSVLQASTERSDIVIVTGGLGPTKDDLTKETVAKLVNKELVYDNETYTRLEAFFISRNRTMTDNNKKQALIVEGAHVLQNDAGLACGMAIKHQNTIFVLLPGPPSELKPMVKSYVLSYLKKEMGQHHVIESLILRFFEIGESRLVEELDDLIKAQTNPTIAPLASDGECMLRLTVKGSSTHENMQKLYALKDLILDRVGEYCYGVGEPTLEEVTANELLTASATVSSAESLTGGLFAELVTSVTGTSKCFKGGTVCYTNEAKESFGVPASVLAEHGAISEQTAQHLAETAKKTYDSTYAVSMTGVAGPDSSENKQPGLVYIGIATPRTTHVYSIQAGGNRQRVRILAAKYAMYYLLKELRKKKVDD